MNLRPLLSALAVTLTLAAAAPLFASELDFTLVNATGGEIDALYLSASDDRDWNENLLPNGTIIAPGAAATVKFEARPTDAQWDIRAVDDTGTAVTFEKVNLLDATTVTLQVEAGKASAIVD